MKSMDELRSSIPQQGQIDWIGVRPAKSADLISISKVKISIESGLDNDHYSKKGGKRMITLIQSEHIDNVSAILGKEISPMLLRRNIVVSRINLLALHDRRFMIGPSVILEGTGHCHPCNRMEGNLGHGGYTTMIGHGGITAKVIQGGIINIKDKVVNL